MTRSHLPAGDGRPVPPVDAVDADAAGRPDGVDVGSVGNVSDDDVPEILHAYTRRAALADGVLVDVSRQASPAEMLGGFVVPVAVTAALWSAIHAIPPSLEGIADARGRLHDVLWLANVAVRRQVGAPPRVQEPGHLRHLRRIRGPNRGFVEDDQVPNLISSRERPPIADSAEDDQVPNSPGGTWSPSAPVLFAVLLPVAGSRKRKHVLRVEIGPDDDGAPCVTIGYPGDF